LGQTISAGLNQKSINDIERALRSLQRQTGMTNAEVMKLAQEMGAAGVAAKKAFSELGIRSSDQIKRQIADIKAAFDQLKNSGTASAQDIARAQAAMQQRIASLNNEMRGTTSILGSLKSSMSGLTSAVGLGIISFSLITKKVLDFELAAVKSAMAFERVRQAYASIFGSGADAQLEFVRDQAKAVGQEFMLSAEAAKTFFAAAKDTTLAPQMNEIYMAVSNAGAAMQLSGEQMQGVFLALGQMVSKGKVQAEELRGQLGERLPGAFQLAAKAMNMTTEELDKFMADGKLTAEDLLPKLAAVLQDKFAGAAEKAAQTVQGSLNNMFSAWEQFKINLAATEPAKFAIQFITSGLEAFNAFALQRDKQRAAYAFLKDAGISADYTDIGVSKYDKERLQKVQSIMESEDNYYDPFQGLAAAEEKRRSEQRKAQDAGRKAINDAFKNTQQGRLQALIDQKAALKSSMGALGINASAEEIERYNTILASLNKQIEDFGKKSAGSASKAANAQGTYNTTLENTKSHIEALEEQLKLDKTESVTAKKIAVTEKYEEQLRKVTNEIEKQVRAGSITASQGEELKALKQKETYLERDVKLRELENKAVEENLAHLQEQLSFYDDLAQMSGNFTISMELQNQIIDIQAQKYRDLKTIPEEMIQKWTEWKKLQTSTDPFDGAYRGLLKFNAEYGDSAKQWENITYNFAKSFEQNIHDMFDEFIDTGKVSFNSMAQMFKNLLKQMAYQALVQPIVLSIVNGVTGAAGGGTAATGQAVANSGTGDLLNTIGGMASNYLLKGATSKVGTSLFSGVVDTFNGTMASWFPSTFAASSEAVAQNLGTQAAANFMSSVYSGGVGSATAASAVGSVSNAVSQVGASSLPTTTASGMLSGVGTMGAGLVGSMLGNYVLAPALGINTNSTGAQIGGAVGGAAGAIGGGILGATAMGAAAGSWGGPIGAGIGALVGTVVGLVTGGALGGDEEPEPGLRFDTYVDLLREREMEWHHSNTRDRRVGLGYDLSGQRWDGMPHEMMNQGVAALHEELQALLPVVDKTQEAVASIGNGALSKSFSESLTRNRYWESHAYWEDEDVTFEEYAKEFQSSFVAQIIKALGDTDMSGIVRAADGKIATTEAEIAKALTDAVQFINLGESLAEAIGDEEVKQQFEEAISQRLIESLKSINTDALGLAVDKTSLEGWKQAAQAFTKMQEVTGAIEELKSPTSDVGKEVQALASQFVAWETELAALGWQTEKITKIDKERVKALKDYADDVINSYNGSGLNYFKEIESIDKTFTDLRKTLQAQGIDAETINGVKDARRQAIDAYIDDVMAQFDEVTNVVAENVKKINDSFAELEKVTSVTLEKENEIRQKHVEAVKGYIDGLLTQYDNENAAAVALKGIADTFGQTIAAMRDAADIYTESDIQNAQDKMTATMRKYVSSVTDAYKTTNNLQRQTDEINATFDELIEGMREAGMAVNDITAAERQRTQALNRLRSETLRGYDQDLSLRVSALNTGGTSSYAYQLLSLAYQQENERSQYEQNIGIDTEQYNRLLLVQQAETLDTKIKLLQSQLSDSLQAELDNSIEMLNVAAGIKSTFSSILRTLKKARQDLWTSDKNLATDRYEEAYRQFNELYAKAMQGDEEALKELASIGNTVLSLGQGQLASRTEYNAAFYDISRKLKDAESVASSQLNIAEKDVETQTRISDSLKRQISTVTASTGSLNSTIGDLDSMIRAYQKQLSSLLDVINSSVNSSADKVRAALLKLNDGTSTSKEAILATKAALMNYGETLAIGQKAGNWTSESVLKEIEKSGLTFDQWYTKYGSKELAEAAKRTGVVVNSIEDLQKITGAYDKLLEAKAKQLNDSMYATSKVAAGGWTADLVRQEIASRGMTVKEWYEKYGKSEGFLLSELNATEDLGDTFFSAINQQTSALVNALLKLNDGTTASKNAILETKAKLMLYGEAINKSSQAGNYTSTDILKAIEDNNMTFDEWYTKFGSKEFAEAAKNTGTVINSITDLKKITDAYDRLLAEKADTLNKSLFTTANVAAGGWTPDLVRQEIANAGMTVKEWYEKYGKSEGYLLKTSQATSPLDQSIKTLGTNLNNYLGSRFATQEEMLAAKLQSLGGGWTMQSMIDEMKKIYGDIQTWFEQAGSKEAWAQASTSTSSSASSSSSKTTSTSTSSTSSSSSSTSSSSTKSPTASSTSTSSNNKVKTTTSTKYASDYDLLVAKVASLNKQKSGGKSNWSVGTALAEIEKWYGTLANWYNQVGKSEGFAGGGVTPVGKAFWVGEEGPELMMSPQSYGVLNNRDSINLMRAGYYGGVAAEDDGLIREIINILRQSLRKIDQFEYDSHKVRQYIQKWDNDGLPATAAY